MAGRTGGGTNCPLEAWEPLITFTEVGMLTPDTIVIKSRQAAISERVHGLDIFERSMLFTFHYSDWIVENLNHAVFYFSLQGSHRIKHICFAAVEFTTLFYPVSERRTRAASLGSRKLCKVFGPNTYDGPCRAAAARRASGAEQ